MLETAAVYWESKVRIYGITEKVGLSLFTIVLPVSRIEYWGTKIQGMADDYGSFELVFVQKVTEEILKFCMVIQESPSYFQRRQIEMAVKNETDTSFHIDFPVELISFHGPHFQDRYGIAYGVFEALERVECPFFAAGCTGTSVYAVLPDKMARQAAQLLAETFIVPQVDENMQKKRSESRRQIREGETHD